MTTLLNSGTSYKVENNIVVNQGVSAGNVGNFKNRIINGDMRVDQRGDDGATATGALMESYLTYKVPPPSYYTVDRFAIAAPNIGNPVAKKVALSADDTNATGFTTAAQISPVPVDSLMAYFPFESNLSDVSGQNVSLTVTGAVNYVPSAVVGSTALYFANEANVTAGTAAANRITCPNFVFPQSFSVSLWALSRTQHSTANDSLVFTTNTANTVTNYAIFIAFRNATLNTINCGFYNGTTTSSVSYVINEYRHLIITYNLGTLTLYVDGSFVGSTTGTLGQSGFILGTVSPTVSQSFAGYIDDFRIYNRVLGPSEISALAFNIGIPMAPPVDASWITQLTLDNTTADARGGLPAPVPTGKTVFTPVCKTGSFAMDLTANNGAGASTSTATTALTYNLASGNYNVPITFMGWFNAKAVTFIQIPFVIGNNSSANNQSLQIYPNTASRIVYDISIAGTNYNIYPTATINLGTWYHVATSASSTPTTSGYMNCYLNGRLVGSRILPAGSSTVDSGSGVPTQLRIGAQTGTNIGYNFQGFIDDVRIYNKALTSRDIAGIYASSQYASYTIFKQPIEANNIYDLAWGTASAQPITASMWIKNNTSNTQSFSVSVQNAGANMIAWIPFENGSVADVLGFLNNSSNYAAPLSTSVYKVGTASLDLSANTAGGAILTNRRVDYNIPFAIQLPLTISFWMYSISPGGGVYQIPVCLGTGVAPNPWIYQFVIHTSGQLYTDVGINNTYYGINTNANTAITANTWYHICATYGNGVGILYMNGINVSQVTYPANGVLAHNTSSLINIMRFGNVLSTSFSQAFKGYIDDFRMYNVALSQASVAQLYANNANTTASSTYLLPRSVVYNPPPIPANTWQKIVLTIPGETTSSFLPNNDTGLTLAVCLGATDLYNTANLASSTNNTSAVWSSMADYMGASNQLYGISDSNFLAYVTNSILITGVQLEKGTLATPFEYRPYGTELRLAQRYCCKLRDTDNVGGIAPATTLIQTRFVFPIELRTIGALSIIPGSFSITDDYSLDTTATPPVLYGNTYSAGTRGSRIYLSGFSGLTIARWYGSTTVYGPFVGIGTGPGRASIIVNAEL